MRPSLENTTNGLIPRALEKAWEYRARLLIVAGIAGAGFIGWIARDTQKIMQDNQNIGSDVIPGDSALTDEELSRLKALGYSRENVMVVRVQDGATWNHISIAFQTPIEVLLAINGMSEDTDPDQELNSGYFIVLDPFLVVPPADASTEGQTPTQSPEITTPPTVEAGLTYVVVAGDTLYSIAVRYGISVDYLKAINSLTGDIIYPGQVLKVK